MRAKGQATIIAIIFSFIALFVYIGMLPAMQAVINDVAPQTDGMTRTVVLFTPVLLFFVILAGVIFYLKPQQEMVG